MEWLTSWQDLKQQKNFIFGPLYVFVARLKCARKRASPIPIMSSGRQKEITHSCALLSVGKIIWNKTKG
jgi:hypothetical protein